MGIELKFKFANERKYRVKKLKAQLDNASRDTWIAKARYLGVISEPEKLDFDRPLRNRKPKSHKKPFIEPITIADNLVSQDTNHRNHPMSKKEFIIVLQAEDITGKYRLT